MSNGDAMRPYDAGWAHFAMSLAHQRPLPHTCFAQVSDSSEAASSCPALPGFQPCRAV